MREVLPGIHHCAREHPAAALRDARARARPNRTIKAPRLAMTMLVAALAACGEVVSSPGYVLNGGFAGAWVRDDPDRSSDMPARIELAIADRVDLLTSADPHTGEMSFEPRLLARGVLTLDAESHPFRLDWRTQPGFWVSYGANDDERGFSIWLDSYRVTRQASRRRPQRDVLFVRFGEGRADTYRRE